MEKKSIAIITSTAVLSGFWTFLGWSPISANLKISIANKTIYSFNIVIFVLVFIILSFVYDIILINKK